MSKAVDVLFINPSDRKKIYQDLGDEFCGIEPPIFAGLYANYVRRFDIVPAIYDAPALRASAQEVARVTTEEYSPRLVVLVVYGQQPSASTQNMGAAGRIARQIKAIRPELPIMMLGTHPAALPERTMREEAIDFVCDLEGPVTIRKTVEALKAGATDFSDIPSLWWRDGERIVRPQSAEPLIRDLDTELPGIAWDLLPMHLYRAHNWHCFDHIHERTPYASIHTSLGCPYKCCFCCINAPFGKSSYRMWSPEAVVREIDHLVETYGIKNIKIADEMFVLNKRHVRGICELLVSRPYKVNIWAYARVDTVDDDMLPLPCNPGAIAIGYALRHGEGATAVTGLLPRELLLQAPNTITFESHPEFRAKLLQLLSLSCSGEPMARLLGELLCCLPKIEVPAGLSYDRVFRVAVVSFLDRFNFCLGEVKRSCIHVATAEGALIPLDTYNLFHRPGLPDRRAP